MMKARPQVQLVTSQARSIPSRRQAGSDRVYEAMHLQVHGFFYLILLLTLPPTSFTAFRKFAWYSYRFRSVIKDKLRRFMAFHQGFENA